MQILCNVPPLGGLASSTTYYLYSFLATFASGVETVTEKQSIWTGPPPYYGLTLYGKNLGGDPAFGSGCLTGDFNGDGLTDIACPSSAENGTWNMGISTGVGFAVSTWTTNDQNFHRDCATGDFNGDGKTDIICYVDGQPSNPLNIYLSTGSGFQNVQNWAFSGLPPPQDNDGSNPRDSSVFSTICSIADLNGDAKSDLLCYANNGSSSSSWIYGLSTGAAFNVANLTSITPPVVYSPDPTPVQTAGEPFASACILDDFQGTGLVDILCNPTTSQNGTITSLQPYDIGVLSRP